MSNNSEVNLLVEVTELAKDLEHLADAVKQSTVLLTNHTEKDGQLHQRINTIEHSQQRQEKNIDEIRKILLDNPDTKQQGLVSEVREIKKEFIDYVKLIKIEKKEAKDRAIEREKERLAIEEKKEKAKMEIENAKEKVFNRKIAVLSIILGILTIFLPLLIDLLKGNK